MSARWPLDWNDSPRNPHSSYFCHYSLNSWDLVSCFASYTMKLAGLWFLLTFSCKPFFHFYFPFILFVHRIICKDMLVYSFQLFFYVLLSTYWMCKWEYLVFPSVYLVLLYHGYTNSNISPWWVETQLNILPTTKQLNILICLFHWIRVYSTN